MRRILSVLVVAAALTGCGAAVPPAGVKGPVVRTAQGEVRGAEDGGVRRFRALPYAAPPVGEARWRAPRPAPAWKGVRDATRPGPACMQLEAPDMPKGTPTSEDCLTVEVTTPARPGANRPVMVWVPGGGFLSGAGSIYDPTRLVETGDIVVVTVNYRLGVFGFFAHPELGRETNFGLQDQVAALNWVRANIARFGGDPGRVTLAGASAGAMSVCTLMTSPPAKGLFGQAVVESGSCLMSHPAGALGPGLGQVSSWHPLGTVQRNGRALAERMSCADVACLRGKKAGDLLPHTGGFPLLSYGTPFVPREPAKVFAAGKEAAVPLLQGNTRDEHAEFTLWAYPGGIGERDYPALLKKAFGAAAARVAERYPRRDHPSAAAAVSRVFSDRDWICPTWKSGRLHARKAPTYAYLFTDPTAPAVAGPLPPHMGEVTAHGAETFALFDFVDAPGKTAGQRALAERVVGYWTRFVRTGDPNGGGGPPWPRLDGTDRALELAQGAARPYDMKGGHHCGLWF
ncbi:carboxylesterase/lipase family protein [Nonomuraea sp. NPDC050547]|uniref:carboxylesterase/lipase family protein n=1 Tax=Nonomuraea sp. NPDC050547 TaxID=3364368 RepID=UPI0037AF4953